VSIDYNKPFVGHYIEFFEIILTDLGGAHHHFAPSVDYDEVTGATSAFLFAGMSYEPIPIKLTGVVSTTSGAPSTPTLTISNIHKRLMSDIQLYDGLVGAKVVRHRTFSEYVGASQEMQIQNFLISQMLKIDREQVVFKLNIPIDFEGTKLPFRVVLKDDGFPGVSRNGSRAA